MEHLALWEKSAQAWSALMEGGGDSSRVLILDEPMLRLAGDVRSLKVCDVGCGEGRFSRMLSDRGAHVVGVDPVRGLLSNAKHRDQHGAYVRAGGEAIPLKSETFDLVVCYLVLIDIPDFRSAIAEIARITKPGGRILIANMNSFTTTLPNPFVRDENGVFQHVLVGDYLHERTDVIAWAGVEVLNYHRPFEAYMQALLGQSLRLTHFEEPQPAVEAVVAYPRAAPSLQVPNFHVMQWRKDA